MKSNAAFTAVINLNYHHLIGLTLEKKMNTFKTIGFATVLTFLSAAVEANEYCPGTNLGNVKLWSGNPLSTADPKLRASVNQSIEDPKLLELKSDSSFVSPQIAGPISEFVDHKTKLSYLITSNDRYMWAIPLNEGEANYKSLTKIIGHAEKSFVSFGKCNLASENAARVIGSPYATQKRNKQGELLDSLIITDPYGNFVGELKHPLDPSQCELTSIAGNNKQNSVVVNGRPPHRGNDAGAGDDSVCGSDAKFWNPMFAVANPKDYEKIFVFDRQGAMSETSELKEVNITNGCVNKVAANFPNCNVTSMVYNDKSESLVFACNATNGYSKILKVNPETDTSPQTLFEGGSKFWTNTHKQPLLQEMVSIDGSDEILLSGNGYIYSYKMPMGNQVVSEDPQIVGGLGVEASNRYSSIMSGYNFYEEKSISEIALPYNQADGPVYMSVFSRFAKLPNSNSYLYCGRFKYQHSCWEIQCSD